MLLPLCVSDISKTLDLPFVKRQLPWTEPEGPNGHTSQPMSSEQKPTARAVRAGTRTMRS